MIENDIWNWITDYVETDHKFYDYKFPPCPYARSARLKGLVDVKAYSSGSIKNFILEQVDDLITDKTYNIKIMAFPARVKWYFHIRYLVSKLNKKLVALDYYAQYGIALNTKSKYVGLFENGPYFIIIVNKLSDVLDAHKSLLSTTYYDNWADKHYDTVVTRRTKIYEKYSTFSKKVYENTFLKIRKNKKIKKMRDEDPYIYK